MATSPYQTLGDIRQAVLDDFKENTSAQTVSQVDRWINEGEELIINRKKRQFLNKTFPLKMFGDVEDTISVTNGSTTATWIGTAVLPITATDREFKLAVQGFEEVYDVSSFTSAAITLNSAYLGDTNTAATGIFFQSAVFLDQNVRSVHKVYHQYHQLPVRPKGNEDFQDLVQLDPKNRDKAAYWTIRGLDLDSGQDQQRFEVFPYPNEDYTLYVAANIYRTELTGTNDSPILPLQTRAALYWYAFMKLAIYHGESPLIEIGTARFQDWLSRIDGEFFPENQTLRLVPDRDRWAERTSFIDRRERID